MKVRLSIRGPYFLMLLLILYIFTGCTPVETTAPPVSGVLSEAGESRSVPGLGDGGNLSAHRTLTAGDYDEPDREMQAVIFGYMDRYYKALSSLEMAELSDLFEDTAKEGQILNEAAWEYLIGIRAMQKTDLRLAGFRYELSVLENREQEDGSVVFRFDENSVQRFARNPEIDTELFHVLHTFKLVYGRDGWKIRAHIQEDGIYQNIMGEYWGTESEKIPNAGEFFAARKELLLRQAEEQREMREQEYGRLEEPQVQHSYDRGAAVAYAGEWVGRRNEIWSDFTGQGGNYQNFVSQCLFAGGIPRDISGNAVWSWKREGGNMWEDTVSVVTWINVEAFRQYAADNLGYGLVAAVDAPYMEGESGDVIQMGFPGGWSHAVLIADTVLDKDGNTVDYLIDSNTSDVKNFPASAYPLPCQSLTKIYGWSSE